jgi:hypothetical protein
VRHNGCWRGVRRLAFGSSRAFGSCLPPSLRLDLAHIGCYQTACCRGRCHPPRCLMFSPSPRR